MTAASDSAWSGFTEWVWPGRSRQGEGEHGEGHGPPEGFVEALGQGVGGAGVANAVLEDDGEDRDAHGRLPVDRCVLRLCWRPSTHSSSAAYMVIGLAAAMAAQLAAGDGLCWRALLTHSLPPLAMTLFTGVFDSRRPTSAVVRPRGARENICDGWRDPSGDLAAAVTRPFGSAVIAASALPGRGVNGAHANGGARAD